MMRRLSGLSFEAFIGKDGKIGFVASGTTLFVLLDALDASFTVAGTAAGSLMGLAEDQQTNRTVSLRELNRWRFNKLTVISTTVWLCDDTRRLIFRFQETILVFTAVNSRGTLSCSHSFYNI